MSTTSSTSPLRKKMATGLVGLLAFGGTLGLAAPAALAQDDAPPAPTQEQIDAKLERLAQAVADGRISQERADQIAERIESGEFVGRHGRRAGKLQGVTEALGLDAETIREGFQNGQSLAEIAAANGADVDALIDTLVAGATERIEAKVADGAIDADRAAEVIDGLEERITERINRTPGERGERPGA